MMLANASTLSSAFDYFEGNISNISADYWGIFDSSKMPVWEIVFTIVCLVSIIIFTVVGNILVILSVCTYTPLRTAQNFFIVSLAVADLTVAFLVLPFNVAYITMGRWVFGVYMCQMWLTCDILCCTASILNLSAIALDRYWAITDPINYANKRTLNLVLSMITGVWVLSFVICLPPLVGWNDWPAEYSDKEPCQLTEKKGFVVFSSLGSFFIPLVLMLIVYVEIFRAIRRRSRERARQSKINQMSGKVKIQHPEDSVVSDNGQNGIADNYKQKLVKHKRSKSKLMVTVPLTDSPTSLAPAVTPKDESTSENDKQKKEPQVLCPQALPPELKTTDVIVKIAPGGANQIHQFIEERQKISLSKERRAARTLGIIVGVFIVCWLPFFLMYVINPFCENCMPRDERIINFITWLGYVNSCLNPVIYTIFNVEFRRAFAKLLKCSDNIG